MKKHFRYVPESLYSASHFPPYCSGSAFILNIKMATKSVDAFKKDTSFFWVDDVFLTGINKYFVCLLKNAFCFSVSLQVSFPSVLEFLLLLHLNIATGFSQTP